MYGGTRAATSGCGHTHPGGPGGEGREVAVSSDYTRLQDLLTRLDDEQNAYVLNLQANALGYAWGQLDAAQVNGDALNFSNAYALHAAEFRAGVVVYRESLHEAWQRWILGEPVDGGYRRRLGEGETRPATVAR